MTKTASKCLCLYSILQSAFAQDLSRLDVESPPVVVTATRFEESTSRAIGVQVLSARRIAETGALDVPTVLERAAGVYLRDNSGSPSRQIDLRGFGISGDQNVLVLLDGQRISEFEIVPANLSSIPLSSVERIEIVRGSGAVLYGAGATAGVINIITRAPAPGQKGARVAAGVGSLETLALGASGEFSSEVWGAALAADRYQSDNYRENNRVEENRVNATLRWFLERGDLTLRLSGSDQELRLPGERTKAQVETDRRGTSKPDDFSTLKAGRASLTGRANLALGEVIFDLSYRERNSDSDQTAAGKTAVDGEILAFSPRLRSRFQLLRMANELIVGMDAEDWDYRQRVTFGNFVQNAKSRQRTSATYFLNTLNLTPSLQLSVGARRQWLRYQVNDESAPPEITQKRSLNAWEVALRERFDEEIGVYARHGRSFRFATVDENRFLTELLEPQTSHDSEVGVEASREDLRMRAAIYQIRLRDEIMFLPGDVVPPFGANGNLPPTRRKGLELDLGWSATPWLGFDVGYHFVDAKFREGNFGGADVSGKSIPLVPRHRGKLAVSILPRQGLRLTATATYVGSQRMDNDQSNTAPFTIPSYTLLGLGAEYQLDKLTLRANLNNLTGEKYFTYAVVNGAKTSFNAYPAAEFNAFVGVEYRF